MRLALGQTYLVAGFSPLPSYTEPVLAVAMTIKRLHIAEIQVAVMAIE